MLRAFLAITLDGHIARRDGSFDFLEPYNSAYTGFAEFMASIGSIVMGRTSYDQAMGLDRWAFGERPIAVLTSRPLPEDTPDVHIAVPRPSRSVIEDLESRAPGKDVWMFGGGRTIAAFHRLGLIDRYELGLVPLILGDGIPLFPPGTLDPTDLTLTKVHQHDRGLLELWYEPVR